MCGFAGVVIDKSTAKLSQSIIEKMGDSISHRGPDSSGVWLDAEIGIAMVHRRLSILDLSPSGHQPMQSSSGRFTLVFNGEIYNHLSIRSQISDAYQWRGHSDTETILAGFEIWGIKNTIQKSTGMFSLAVWDAKEKSLSLFRDRIGEKPLYYGWQNGSFLFGSELKSLIVHPSFQHEIDRNSLSLFMRYGYVPSPASIYKGIQKLAPASFIELFPYSNSFRNEETPVPAEYWSLAEVVSDGQKRSDLMNSIEIQEKLDFLLREVIDQQMVADVPVGAFLSGGIDSSTIVAIMQTLSRKKIKTFSVGIEAEGYNEAPYAKEIAEFLGTDHTELFFSDKEARNIIPDLPGIYDEPFSDPSQIPTFYLSQVSRKDVAVSLSGDAGDELFAGYNRYFLGDLIHKINRNLPRPLMKALTSAVYRISPQIWDTCFSPIKSFLPTNISTRPIGDRLHKLAKIFQQSDFMSTYVAMMSHWQDPSKIVINGSDSINQSSLRNLSSNCDDLFHKMMAFDTVTYLPDDILVKVDRAAMSCSLETRLPFLNHHLVEFAWQIPLSMKIKNGKGKSVLRNVLYKYIPQELFDRPKTGFGLPIHSWLRGPLREWAESLLNESRLKNQGYLETAPITEKWQQHLSGHRNWHLQLWNVLIFQSWFEEYRA